MGDNFLVDNVIILAAGRGSRLKELTKIKPKPLLKNKNGIPMIEDLIIKIRQKKIQDIFIVVGYKSEMFKYLIKKYDVHLIKNDNWNKSNNSGSIAVALDKMRNSLIINGDIVMNENIIENKFRTSITYAEKNLNINEWCILRNKDNNILDFDKNGINKKGYFQREITFITNDLRKKMKLLISKFNKDEYYEYLVVEAALKYDIDFKIHEIKKNMITDIDTVEEYIQFTK